MSPARRRQVILGGALAGALATTVSLLLLAPGKGRISVRRHCDSSGESLAVTLHHGEPACIALLLDDGLPKAALVEMSVARTSGGGARTTATHSWPLAENDDQVLYRAADVRTLSGGQTGAFDVSFRIGDDVVAEQTFEVAEAAAATP